METNFEDSAFVIEVHDFQRKLGNEECARCGREKETRKHPHTFLKGAATIFCVCGVPARGLIHQMGDREERV